MSKNALLVVEGGLGKQIMSMSLLKGLANKYTNVFTVSPYPDIFKASPYVTESFQHGVHDITNIVYDKGTTIFGYNPYQDSRFIKKEAHLMEVWNELVGLEYDENLLPEINLDLLDPIILKETEKIKKDLNKFIIVQFSGGQAAMTNGQGQYIEILKRNYKQGQELVDLLIKKYPDHKILNYSLPNEPYLMNTVRLEAPYIFYFDLVKSATQVICIDSSLQHIAAAVNKPATVIWGETRPEHFGWKIHNNIVKDKQKGAPYFNALGPSLNNLDFPTPEEIIGISE